jgi:hypothetical protein
MCRPTLPVSAVGWQHERLRMDSEIHPSRAGLPGDPQGEQPVEVAAGAALLVRNAGP